MNDWLSIFNAPWAISDEGMESMLRSFGLSHSGPDSGSQFFGLHWEDAKTEAPRKDHGNIAVIEICGPLVKRPMAAPRGFEVASYEAVRASVENALGDDSIDAVILDIDSPGGTVDGNRELAEYLYSVRDNKPMTALANGMMTSAAQYIGASIGRIVATSPSTLIGSIGVIQLHVDWSKLNAEIGVNPTWMHAGKFKAVGNPDEPLSKDDRAYLQERLDQSYEIFTSDVARYLGLNPAETTAWADGQHFRATVGLELGLVHDIKTRQELIASLKEEAMTKTAAELRNDHPGAVQEIVSSTEKAVLTKAEKDTAAKVEKATATATDECLSMVGVILGDEAKGKLEPVLKASTAVEQATAIAAAVSAQPEGDGDDTKAEVASSTSRAAILEGLQKSDQGGVKPGGQTEMSETQKQDQLIAEMAELDA